MDDDKQALAKLSADGIRIPAQPKVLIELGQMIASGNTDNRAFSKVIGQDPGLVATLFKAARSPAFSRGRKLESLNQVLMVIGVKQAYTLVQAAAVSTSLSDSKRKAFEAFWMRSGEIAQLAALIANDTVTVCNVFPEQAYMAGIFHECGVPVLMMRFPQYCEAMNIGADGKWPNIGDEDEKFKVDHCTVGYLVARHWGLPDFICHAIRYHQEMPDEGLGASISLMCILQLAINFYHRINHQPNPVWDSISDRVLDELGIAEADEDDYFEDISQRFLSGAKE